MIIPSTLIIKHTYKLTNDAWIVRDDGALIPNDPGNRDYQEYLAWVAKGNVATPKG